MLPYATLVNEYRGELLDLVHNGYLTIVDENSNVLFNVGDPETKVYYRSASKPLQALPIIALNLDKKYGLTEEETVIFSGSHTGEVFHVAALERIMEKTELTEDMLVMKPAVPFDRASNEARIKNEMPPRKIYHNCSGKHLGLMLLQRELGGYTADYWKKSEIAQKEVKRVIKTMSETDEVSIGIDGCGVPVFAVGMKNIAIGFKNLACLDTIKDEGLQDTATRYIPRLNKYNYMMRGTGYLCSLLNKDPNIVAKGGSNGIYGFGLKKQRLGISFKLIDGTEKVWPTIIMTVLRGLKCLSEDTEVRLNSLNPFVILNDNDIEVGCLKAAFSVNI